MAVLFASGIVERRGQWPIIVWTVNCIVLAMLVEEAARSRSWRRMRRDQRAQKIVDAMLPEEKAADARGEDVDHFAIEARADQVRRLKVAADPHNL